MTVPDRPDPAVPTVPFESSASTSGTSNVPEKPAPRYGANLRLIRSRLADEERMRPKRWWNFLS